MKICSDNHDEIAYEEKKCPLCVFMKDSKSEVDSLKERLAETEKRMAEQEQEIEALREPLLQAAREVLATPKGETS